MAAPCTLHNLSRYESNFVEYPIFPQYIFFLFPFLIHNIHILQQNPLMHTPHTCAQLHLSCHANIYTNVMSNITTEKSHAELEETVEYEMDSEDERFVHTINEANTKLKSASSTYANRRIPTLLSDDAFEKIIDVLEKEAFRKIHKVLTSLCISTYASPSPSAFLVFHFPSTPYSSLPTSFLLPSPFPFHFPSTFHSTFPPSLSLSLHFPSLLSCALLHLFIYCRFQVAPF